MSVLDVPSAGGPGPDDGVDLEVSSATADPPEVEIEVDEPRADVLRRLLDLVVVASSAGFVFWQLHPDLILADTTPAGGDMGAHVWAFAYLRDTLLPNLRFSGWAHAWYAGFPVFHFYMVVPFLAMVVLNAGLVGWASVLPAAGSVLLSVRAGGASLRDRVVLGAVASATVLALALGLWHGFNPSFRFSLQVAGGAAAVAALVWGRGSARRRFAAAALVLVLVGVSLPYGSAFKIVSVAGVVAMPVAGYLFGRLARLPYPAPPLLAVAALGFLFDKNFTIYGGNIASTLAGEFAFSMSLSLAIVYLGVVVRGLRTGGHRVPAAVLLALVGLTHLIPAFFALGATAVLLVLQVIAERPAPPSVAAAVRMPVVAGLLVLLAALVVSATGLATTGPVALSAAAALVAIGIVAYTRVGSDAAGDPLARPRWVLTSGAVAALLAAWWVLPFFLRRAYLNDMGWEKIAVHHSGTAIWDWFSDEVWPLLVPLDLRVFAALALVGAVLSVAFRSRVGTALVLLGFGLALAFVYAPQGRLWNARLLPFWYLVVYFLAAIGVAEMVRAITELAGGSGVRRRGRLAAAPVLLLVLGLFLAGQLRNVPGGAPNADGSYRVVKSVGIPGLFSVDVPDALALDVSGRNFVTDWSRWNYSGYERKQAYPEYRGIVTTMAEVVEDHGCGRSLWEYSPDLNDYGTPMALMLLPHWTDGCIDSMEGLYFEASSTTPYHFLLQSETSASPSRAQRDLPYSELDLDAGVDHMQLLGVSYYLARSAEANTAARAHPDLTEIAANGPWIVYQVADAPLVEPMAFEPVVTTADESQAEWLGCLEGHEPCPGAALEWFQDPSRWDVALAASGPAHWQRVDIGQRPARRPVEPAAVSELHVDEDTITFHVDRVGAPVLVKVSYFPNWRATGADGPYRVAPNLMLVVPTDEEVTLQYGRTPVDVGSVLLTLVGVVALVALARRPKLAVTPLRDAPGTVAAD